MTWLSAQEQTGLIQGSEAWLAWRKMHIGASEIPALMGVDDWRSPYDLFIAKTQGETFTGNFATERGKSLEALIIATFETNHRCRLTQPTLEFKEWPVLSASLDGWEENERFIVECKAPAVWKHTMALCGLVPDTYQDQIQTQLLVTGATKAYYTSFNDNLPEGFDYAEVIVEPDLDRQKLILERAKAFWEIVQKGVWDETFCS